MMPVGNLVIINGSAYAARKEMHLHVHSSMLVAECWQIVTRNMSDLWCKIPIDSCPPLHYFVHLVGQAGKYANWTKNWVMILVESASRQAVLRIDLIVKGTLQSLS